MGKMALSIGANTFAFFTRNPRGGKAKAIDHEDIDGLKNLLNKEGFGKLVAHAPYTMNPCSKDEKVRDFAYMAMVEDLRLMELLPNNYYNFHPGSHVGQGEEAGIQMIADLLNRVITKEQTTTILLETMAGKGSEVGKNFQEIKAIIDKVDIPEKVGVCLDTCHIHDGGYDIVSDPEGVLDEFDKIIGLDKLKALHINDSKNVKGAAKDRHACIGEGEIGAEAIIRFVTDPRIAGLPCILETPQDDLDGYREEIKFLRNLEAEFIGFAKGLAEESKVKNHKNDKQVENSDSRKTDILVINPGSTSTKMAVFRGDDPLFEISLAHEQNELDQFPTIPSQEAFRRKVITDRLKSENYDMSLLRGVVGRGGMLIGINQGGYLVTKEFCKAMENPELPQHASNLGALLAYEIGEELGIPAFIYDSTMGCRLMDIAQITGIAELEKYGCCHVLNSRAQAMKYAEEIGKPYEDLNLILCHMGGGITVNAQKKGVIIDTAAYDDGPMSPERSGGVPMLLFKDLAYSGKYTKEEATDLIGRTGGLYSYLGTKNCIEIEERIANGDEKAALVYEAMAFQIAKAIAGLTVSLEGDVDAIILTGGIAHSKKLVSMIEKYSSHLGKIVVKAGELELEALAAGAKRMLDGVEEAQLWNQMNL